MAEKGNIAKRILRFYADGFRNMTVGRTLWAIIIVKLVVIFESSLHEKCEKPLYGKRSAEYVAHEPAVDDNNAERAAAVRSALSAPEPADER